MSIKDITNYVRQTPGNTNPNVIRSMVEAQVGEYVDEAANEALRKLGIKEATEEKVLLDEHLAPGDEFDPGTGVMYDGTLDLVAGKTYTIVTNSGTYKATCKLFGGHESMPYVGNVALVGGEDTGESFLVFFDGANEMVSAIDFNGGTHMKVSEVTETITPIDQKYLPSGGLPFVELETVPSFKEGQPTALSKSDIATINGICTSGIKCFVVSVYVQALKLYMTTVLTAVNGNGFSGFVGILPLITDIVSIVISQDGEDGAWIITTANPN